MKKIILAMILTVAAFGTFAGTTQAEENLKLSSLVYPSSDEAGEYYSLTLVQYGMNYKKLKKNNISHVVLSSNKVYTLLEYGMSYSAAKRTGDTGVLNRALTSLNAKPSATLNILDGKVADGKVIADPDAAPVEFKVIDIK